MFALYFIDPIEYEGIKLNLQCTNWIKYFVFSLFHFHSILLASIQSFVWADMIFLSILCLQLQCNRWSDGRSNGWLFYWSKSLRIHWITFQMVKANKKKKMQNKNQNWLTTVGLPRKMYNLLHSHVGDKFKINENENNKVKWKEKISRKSKET